MKPEQSVLLPRHQAVFDRDKGPNHLFTWGLNKLFTHKIQKLGGLTVVGEDNLSESAIIAPNHLDEWDHAVVGKAVLDATGRAMHFASKPEYWYEKRGLAKGWFVELGGGFPIDRDKLWHEQPEVMKRINKIFIERGFLGVYGQAKRIKDPEIPVKIKKGIAMLSLGYGWGVIPVGIAGTIERHDMVVVFGELIKPTKSYPELITGSTSPLFKNHPSAHSRATVLLHSRSTRSLKNELEEKIQAAKDEAEERRRFKLGRAA